jgi:hypothetical protein
MPPDPTTRPRPAMVRDPHAYTLVRTIATRDAPGQSVRCDRCGTRILDPARVGSDPVALASLRHGDVILDDTAYVVRGPDGERSLCLRCVEHAGITRETTGEQAAAPSPTPPGALLWRRRWSLLALAAPLIVLVGVVRVALGADDPSDVLGGWTGALVWTIGVSLTLTPPLRPDTPATGTNDG